MKFAVAFVLLSVALGAQSSVIPLQSVLGGPLVANINGVQLLQNPWGAAVALQGIPSQALITSGPVPSIVAAPAPAVVSVQQAVVAAPQAVVAAAAPASVVVAAAPAGGTYVAQTRGATHVAPLAGHANSASSINLQPAPGTV